MLLSYLLCISRAQKARWKFLTFNAKKTSLDEACTTLLYYFAFLIRGLFNVSANKLRLFFRISLKELRTSKFQRLVYFAWFRSRSSTLWNRIEYFIVKFFDETKNQIPYFRLMINFGWNTIFEEYSWKLKYKTSNFNWVCRKREYLNIIIYQ